jgi:hypothetical protein
MEGLQEWRAGRPNAGRVSRSTPDRKPACVTLDYTELDPDEKLLAAPLEGHLNERLQRPESFLFRSSVIDRCQWSTSPRFFHAQAPDRMSGGQVVLRTRFGVFLRIAQWTDYSRCQPTAAYEAITRQ